ncbi:hypothetical protein T05_796 [Trichinella murrelli]|uniref:Uncharacterized protein n=1 Tax=Trichinella murrelli TaxID=144512 RepID=A0A0V0U733_9BILA|nr:hypothetical protein T05_796 [Trichinella murrelli]
MENNGKKFKVKFLDCYQQRFLENTLHSEFEAAITAIRLVLSITEYSDDINMDIKNMVLAILYCVKEIITVTNIQHHVTATINKDQQQLTSNENQQ